MKDIAKIPGVRHSRRLIVMASIVSVIILGFIAYNIINSPLSNWRSTRSLRNEALELFPVGSDSQVIRRQLLELGFVDVEEPVDSFGTEEHHDGAAPHLQMYAMRRPAVNIAYLTHSTQFVFIFDMSYKLIDIKVRRFILAL